VGHSVVSLAFSSPPKGHAALDLLAECERQMRPVVQEIVQSAVAAGWSQEDVLLTLVEVSWDMYEECRET
jgi:hypothetical protein